MNVIDYRLEPGFVEAIPFRCRECGGPIIVREKRGVSHIRDIDLRTWVRGRVTELGTYETRWWAWECEADRRHDYGPIATA